MKDGSTPLLSGLRNKICHPLGVAGDNIGPTRVMDSFRAKLCFFR
jgi:hypothetical protein